MNDEDIRVVVGVDFGTTFSGFAYAHVQTPNDIQTHETWPAGVSGSVIQHKANTILHYDNHKNVIAWGCEAVARRSVRGGTHVIELFKLYLLDGTWNNPRLPQWLDFQTATRDYLKEMNDVIKEQIEETWRTIAYPQNVRFVFTVPAEFGDAEKGLMRRLIYEAGFMENEHVPNLEFTTEPEAAAIHCLKLRKQYDLNVGDKYLTVDCGGGTCDLTVREVMEDGKIGEITERSGGVCGGSLVDKQFIDVLQECLGESAIATIKNKHYPAYQHLVDHWCREIKHNFTGDPDSIIAEIDLDQECPPVKDYITDGVRARLEQNEWQVEFDYDSVKRMFDPIVDEIIHLIEQQIANVKDGNVAMMFLVGGFAESKYLQKRIKSAFGSQVQKIYSPPQPAAAIVRGAVHYGLNMAMVHSRVLKWTYGLETHRLWTKDDPEERLLVDSGKIKYFQIMAEKGKRIAINDKVKLLRYPFDPDQTEMNFHVFMTEEANPRFTDEPGMKLLGTLVIDLPDNHLKKDRPIEFSLTFGTMEIIACAVNRQTKRPYNITFEVDWNSL